MPAFQQLTAASSVRSAVMVMMGKRPLAASLDGAGRGEQRFGVQVAFLAGLPDKVIERAQYLMQQMEKRGGAGKILDGPRFRNTLTEEIKREEEQIAQREKQQ